MEEYKGWKLYDELPQGWLIDKCGSPLTGYEFCISESILKGGKRALVRVQRKPVEDMQPATQRWEPKEVAPPVVMDENYRKTLDVLARKQFIKQLLAEIACEMTVCKLEGWDINCFVDEIKREIDNIAKKLRQLKIQNKDSNDDQMSLW